ncbi:hypothetical protein CVT25_011473, partial [Psilocybe cyanescens]
MPDKKNTNLLSKAAKLRDKVRDRIGLPRSGSPVPGNAQATMPSARGSTSGGASTPVFTTAAPPSGHSRVTQSTAPMISAALTSSATLLASAAAPASVAHSVAATVPAPAAPPASAVAPAPAAPPASASAPAAVPTPTAPPSASAADAGSSGGASSLFHKAKENVQTALKGANVSLKVLKEVSVVFPPLQAAVGGVIACVETYQKTSDNHDEMTRVLENIGQLASMLTARLNQSKDHKLLKDMVERLTLYVSVVNTFRSVIANKSPHRLLNKEIKNIEAMQEPGLFSRMATSTEDIDLGLQVERNTCDILKHVVFQQLLRSNDAAFDAAINIDKASRGPCTEDTRVDIINQIMEWAKENDLTKAPPVYWLSGLGGLGKTTIAYTVCQQLKDNDVSFSSFFCSQQLDSKYSKFLIPTLCRDLAECFSSFAAEILDVLVTDSKVVHAILQRQIDELFVKPWEASTASRVGLPAPVVVIDALDENDRGTDFLKELFRVVQLGKLKGIKFLVTSRPEPELVELFRQLPENAVYKLHEVNIFNVQEDIRKYLHNVLPDLKNIPEVETLADQASGFFIYAATVVRFLEPFSFSQKVEQLQKLLSEWPKVTQSSDKLALDELYENVLKIAFRSEHVRSKNLQILYTVLCAESRVDMSVIAALSGAKNDVVQKVIENLHAVLYVSKDNHIYWYHTSFRDFIFDQNRAKLKFYTGPNNQPSEEIRIDVYCNPSTHHTFLAYQCFYIMKVLCFNICKFESSYLFDSEIADLHTRVKNNIPLKLQYASQYWAKHLVQADGTEEIIHDLVSCLGMFMHKKLLFWIETMNLIGTRVECASLLKTAKNWLKKKNQNPDLIVYLNHAVQFATFFAGSEAAKSTPHLYISVLATWNQNSAVWKYWKAQFMLIPSVSYPKGQIISPLLTIKITDAKSDENLDGIVNSVAFSPDGNYIVSGSAGDLVCVWDAKSGEQLHRLQGHIHWVRSVAFSPDGNYIVSGSDDKLVCVWDAKLDKQLHELQGHTHWLDKQLHELQGHTHWVISVAFSSDGNYIVSGSADNLVCVWDAKSGEQLHKLKGHTDRVNSVAFSPDSNYIASGSNDKSVCVWNAKSGEQLHKLQYHTDW